MFGFKIAVIGIGGFELLFFILVPFVMGLLGVYLITVGLWELRVGVDRKKYATYMFTGLALIVFLAMG
ncbi:hypothetical protein AM506_14225 [Rossellomorea vietnamensis]|uniref:Uncharacterized protein n=1 Tax=Rossellomorea vietnamensis TaxID=218284 RepID=A0A0P6VVM1_9BACI|nr:hypothetical protein AM506_14225 [Rossellomorea vietnamensis]